MKRLFAIACILLASIYAFAAMGGEVIPLDSPLYDNVDRLFILSGFSIPSTSRPWTYGEASRQISRLDCSSVPEMAMELYDFVIGILDAYEEKTSVWVELTPEVYAHGNSSFDLEEYWDYDYMKCKPFGTIGL